MLAIGKTIFIPFCSNSLASTNSFWWSMTLPRLIAPIPDSGYIWLSFWNNSVISIVAGSEKYHVLLKNWSLWALAWNHQELVCKKLDIHTRLLNYYYSCQCIWDQANTKILWVLWRKFNSVRKRDWCSCVSINILGCNKEVQILNSKPYSVILWITSLLPWEGFSGLQQLFPLTDNWCDLICLQLFSH